MSEDLNCGEESASHSRDGQILRQCFDRFDNNLVENILSYLTFNQKVLFESVSKRWQQLVYNQQKELHLTRWERTQNNSLNRILGPLEAVDFTTSWAVENGLTAINKTALKSILKKCPTIESVDLDCFVDFEVLDIIGRYCPRLKSLQFDTTGVNAHDLNEFGVRYGHKIETIRFYYLYPYVSKKYSTHLLIHCKNLKKFSSPRTQELIFKDADYLPKLESVDFYQLYLDKDEDPDLITKFELFCNKYSDILKKLYVYAYWPLTKAQLEQFLSSVATFRQLTGLSINFETSDDFDESIDEYLIQISRNNSSLKYLNFSLYTNILKIDRIFYSFDGFANLVELIIYISTSTDYKSLEGSVQCFKSLTELKSLRLTYEHLSEEFFEDIDKYLPNLSTLIIGCESELTDTTVQQLSNLKKLKVFHLNRYRNCNKQITDQSICAVIEGCPLLEMLYFASRPNITQRTIEALICCAKRNRKKVVHFECGLPEMGDETDVQTIDMNTFIDKIPNNLTIIIDE